MRTTVEPTDIPSQKGLLSYIQTNCRRHTEAVDKWMTTEASEIAVTADVAGVGCDHRSEIGSLCGLER